MPQRSDSLMIWQKGLVRRLWGWDVQSAAEAEYCRNGRTTSLLYAFLARPYLIFVSEKGKSLRSRGIGSASRVQETSASFKTCKGGKRYSGRRRFGMFLECCTYDKGSVCRLWVCETGFFYDPNTSRHTMLRPAKVIK